MMPLDPLGGGERIAAQTLEHIELALDSGAVVGIWVWDVVNDIMFGDERFARAYALDPAMTRKGYARSEATGRIHPDDIDGVWRKINDALARGGPYRAEYRIRRGDGWLWVEASGAVERDGDGKAVRFPGVLVDIDARKRIEQALKDSNDQLSMARRAGGIVAAWTWTLDDNLVRGGEDFARAFLLVGEDTSQGMDFSRAAAAVHPDDLARVYATIGESLKAAAVCRVEYRLRRADGSYGWVECIGNIERNDRGEAERVPTILIDISARKAAEQSLSETFNQLRMAQKAGGIGVFTVAADEDLLTVSEEFCVIFGIPVTETVSLAATAALVLEEDRPARSTVDDRASGTTPIESEYRIRRACDGEIRWVNRRSEFIRDSAGQALYLVGTVRDVTGERQTHAALMEARRAAEAANVAKTEFLANMSHEIRTPMNAVIGLSTILARSEPRTARQTEFIRTLQTSAASLLALINDLLDIAKIESRSVELEHIPFSPEKLLGEVAGMMAVPARDKGLDFATEVEAVRGRHYLGDPTRLRQILVNLCSNAVKFTEAGGVRVVLTRRALGGRRDELCLTVRDTGIGIPAGQLDAIFNKFVQADTSINRKYGGTGLGLAITHTLSEIMGGTIAVSSEPDRGTTFTVCLPLDVCDGDIIDEAVMAAVPEAGCGRVLLVEDYEPNVLVARTFLEGFGYEVDHAANGRDAFDMVAAKTYLAVLMDVQMHGVNGLDATMMIRRHEQDKGGPRVAIIGMTAHALAGDRERCLEAGMDDYLSKPFHPDDLKARLDRVRGRTAG